jgi:predicted TIM-barrel fold metal-dependent hydrolase
VTEVQIEKAGGEADGGAGQTVKLVDCDIHPVMPRQRRLERLSARWRRHYEQFGRRTPPVTEVYPRASNGGMRADAWPDEPGSLPGSDLGLLQRQHLDEYGIDYGVLNSLGLLGCHEVPEFAAELARVENDWLVEQWLDKEPRLLGSIVVPFEHPELSVREIERRASDPRWVQVILADTTEEPLGSRKYWPIYEAAAAHGLPVAVHTGGSAPHQGTGWLSYYLEEHVTSSLVMQNGLLSMVCEGLFEEVPGLRVVLTEGGVTWAVALQWALDSAWHLLHDDVPTLSRPPSEVVHDHVWFSTQPIEEPDDPREFMQALEHGGLANRLVFATDYPHWDFDSPTQALPPSIPKNLRTRILATTACELYGLPLERREA